MLGLPQQNHSCSGGNQFSPPALRTHLSLLGATWIFIFNSSLCIYEEVFQCCYLRKHFIQLCSQSRTLLPSFLTSGTREINICTAHGETDRTIKAGGAWGFAGCPKARAGQYLSISSNPFLEHQLENTCIDGEGNGTPLQYSCLENPMDGGAW